MGFRELDERYLSMREGRIRSHFDRMGPPGSFEMWLLKHPILASIVPAAAVAALLLTVGLHWALSLGLAGVAGFGSWANFKSAGDVYREWKAERADTNTGL